MDILMGQIRFLTIFNIIFISIWTYDVYGTQTVTQMYVKDPANQDTSCVEAIFSVTERSVSRCADLCLYTSNCCGFSFSNISKVCTGCPLAFSVLSQPGNSYYSPPMAPSGLHCGVYVNNGHYYQFITDAPRNWNDATNACLNLGGHLVYVETVLENDFLQNTITQLPGISGTDFWIGASLDGTDGNWKWGNGLKTEDSYMGFNGIEPSGNGNCVLMGFSWGYWDDRSCSDTNKYICEIE